MASVDEGISTLFSLVTEALAGATDALLGAEVAEASRIVAADNAVDTLTNELSARIWEKVEEIAPSSPELRRMVGMLLILPELERSADLAEHIAQRALSHLGPQMSARSRGVVQRMSEVALDMWRETAAAYQRGDPAGAALDEADEELDILHGRLTDEVACSDMAASVAAQITLLGRFYERLGDHAVNLARKMEALLPPTRQ